MCRLETVTTVPHEDLCRGVVVVVVASVSWFGLRFERFVLCASARVFRVLPPVRT